MRKHGFVLEICIAVALFAATIRTPALAQSSLEGIGFHAETPQVVSRLEAAIQSKFGVQCDAYVTPVQLIVILKGTEPSAIPFASVFSEVKRAFGLISPGKFNVVLIYEGERTLAVFGGLDMIFKWLDTPKAPPNEFKLMLAYAVDNKIAYYFNVEQIWGKPIRWF